MLVPKTRHDSAVIETKPKLNWLLFKRLYQNASEEYKSTSVKKI